MSLFIKKKNILLWKGWCSSKVKRFKRFDDEEIKIESIGSVEEKISEDYFEIIPDEYEYDEEIYEIYGTVEMLFIPQER